MRHIAILAAIMITLPGLISAQQNTSDLLKASFDFNRNRTEGTHYYKMQTDVITISPGGKKNTCDTYLLYLAVALNSSKEEKYDITCGKYLINLKNSGVKEIPVLRNWNYTFVNTDDDKNQKGEVLGVDHDKFENLKDDAGNTVPIESRYHAYNSFIDFHALMNVFSEKTSSGNGIQTLHNIGDKIVHSASFSQPPVNLGKNIKEGSYFKNGEIILYFKGLSVVNNNTCAIVNYDSGESSFFVKIDVNDKTGSETNGSSHYFGDIFINLATLWPVKIVLSEFVVSETKVLPQQMKINNSIERVVNIIEITKEEFENK